MRLPHTLVNTSPARSLNAGPAFTHLNEREPMPRQPQLTPRQLAIVDTVRSLLASRGYPPTVREIGDSVGLKSPSSVKHQLDSLIQLGIFSHDPRRSRTLEVTPLGMSLDTETGNIRAPPSFTRYHLLPVNHQNLPLLLPRFPCHSLAVSRQAHLSSQINI